MKTIKVNNMKCIHCKARIEKGLADAGIEAVINLDEKTVCVTDEKLKETLEILDDLGFEAAAVN